MTITVQWYERKPDFKPDYDKVHVAHVHGDKAADCMEQINIYRQNHDLYRFTPLEIVHVED